MSGSDRFFDTAAVARLVPYAAPRAMQPAAMPVFTGWRPAPLPAQAPEPFVARQFRHLVHGGFVIDAPEQYGTAGTNDAAHNGAEVMRPAAEPAEFSSGLASHDGGHREVASRHAAGSEQGVADGNSDSATAAAGSAGAPVAARGQSESGNHDGEVLPSTDEFVQDDEHAHHSWPLGETSQLLDALRPLLMSAEASRERLQARAHQHDERAAGTGKSTVSMWNDSDWGDRVDAAETGEEQVGRPAGNQASVQGAAPQMNAEAAALALEGLAKRVRAGQLWVPAFQSAHADEAILAGLLASMLGSRRE